MSLWYFQTHCSKKAPCYPRAHLSFSGVQHFFSLCSDQGISKETCACLLRSINTQSLCVYLRNWKDFAYCCYTRKIDYSSLSLNVVCDYLIYLFKKGHQVSFLNVARSSLPFFISQLFEIGEHPRIKDFLGFYREDARLSPDTLLLGILVKF